MKSFDWWQCSAVESVPDRMSGAWVLRGTRTPVNVISENLEAGLTKEEIIEQFPVSREEFDQIAKFMKADAAPMT